MVTLPMTLGDLNHPKSSPLFYDLGLHVSAVDEARDVKFYTQSISTVSIEMTNYL